MINTIFRHKLLFPEPNNTGGGDSSSANDNPFNITATPPADDTKGGGGAPPAEYALTFNDADGISDAHRAMFTEVARAAKIDAAAASTFVHEQITRLNDMQAKAASEATAALRSEWGSDFDKRCSATQTFADRLFSASGVTSDEAAMFNNPAGFRVLDKIRLSMGEGNFVGANSSATAPKPAKSNEEQIQELAHEMVVERRKAEPDMSKIRKLRQQMNTLAGLDKAAPL